MKKLCSASLMLLLGALLAAAVGFMRSDSGEAKVVAQVSCVTEKVSAANGFASLMFGDGSERAYLRKRYWLLIAEDNSRVRVHQEDRPANVGETYASSDWK